MSKKNNLFVDFHVIQTVPPSCINRDDTGSPKTATYGGVVRSRVSSQAWKHAMRLMFKDILSEEEVGVRTKRIVKMVESEIIALRPEFTNAEKEAIEALKKAGLNIKDAAKGTDALFFMSLAQAKALAKLAVEEAADKKEYQQAIASAPSVDMALFGRMVASDPSLNYDAAAQVAHSISTHAVQCEHDYFTAVDDCAEEDSSGAGHLGTVEFNSSTLYRYATVNMNELADHLGDGAVKALRGFAEAFIRSMPTGKQNTFANRTMPDAVYVTLRADQPVNMSGAFEKPVQISNGGGYVENSEKALVKYAKSIYENYAEAPQAAFAVGSSMKELGADIMPLSELLDRLESWLNSNMVR